MASISLQSLWSPRVLLIVFLTSVMAFSFGCQRTPEDLEEWRNARGGMEQLSDWAQSDRESMEVRIRAVQIIIEENNHDQVPRILERIKDPEAKEAIANGAFAAVIAMWESDEIPEFTEELQAGGGQIVIGKATEAKDAAYRMHPYLNDENRTEAEKIFREWMSEEQDFRTQIGDVSIPMLVTRAGDGAMELLSNWIKETHDPREVVAQLRRDTTDENHRVIDAAVLARAMEEHPELSREMQHAVAHAESDVIAPYLHKVIKDETTEGEFLQAAVDALIHVSGADAVDFFSEVIAERSDLLRWVSAQAILDAKFPGGIVDIAQALPTETDTYPTSPDDDLKRRATFICNYFNTNLERQEIDDFSDPLTVLLTSDDWPAQVIGLQCAHRTSAVGLIDAVQRLTGNRQQIPSWGERITVGQMANQVHQRLTTVAAEE